MTRLTTVARSALLGSALGAAVGAVVCAIVLGFGLVTGGFTRGEVGDVALAFLPAGSVAGLALGSIAPFPRKKRQRALFVALLVVYPLSAVFSMVLLSTVQHGTLPPAAELVSLKTLAMLAWITAAYVPIVGGPAALALLLLERLTRPTRGNAVERAPTDSGRGEKATPL